MFDSLSLKSIDPSWQSLLKQAFATLQPDYINMLNHSEWLPGPEKIFNAFSLPVDQVNYILFGESPYPRTESANGYAFWDNAVTNLWSETGLAKEVNRATSLRNIVKMLLLAAKKLTANDLSQQAIAKIDKTHLIQSIADLFGNMQKRGILLLNATLVLRKNLVPVDVKSWQPFMNAVLLLLQQQRPTVKLILLGKLAAQINALPAAKNFPEFVAEHPYNISFITNPKVLEFFGPLELLKGVN
ncbi:uracil-DNA glycosylase [soil metagenome]